MLSTTLISDGVKTPFQTETVAKTQMSRHETSQDVKAEARRD